MILPSEDLLKEVLKIGEDSIIDDIEVYKNNILYAVDGQCADEINIYELMHLMKEWLILKGYRPITYPTMYNTWVCQLMNKKDWWDTQSIEDTEFEAVTKSCEWVMEQKVKDSD